MNEIRYEIIITFLENADNLMKTVQSCENQISENDRIIIVGTGNLEQIKSLKEIKKYKKQITFKQAATIANAYNECVRESESQYTIFMKEGDWLGEDFLKHAASVMENEKEQQIDTVGLKSPLVQRDKKTVNCTDKSQNNKRNG